MLFPKDKDFWIMSILEKAILVCGENFGVGGANLVGVVLELVMEVMKRNEKCKERCLDVIIALISASKHLIIYSLINDDIR